MNRQKRSQIFCTWQKANPNPTTELVYSSPFELLISVILSAQATDVSVNKATKSLFQIAPTAESMAKLGLAKIRDHIKTIGLYNTKAKNVLATCKQLVKLHNGDVPGNREELEALPGVGRKTANVILNTAFGEPTIAVDTHIFRVSNRTGIAPGKNVVEVEKRLIRLVPDEFKVDAHHWLILHGRYVCKARKPECPGCTINSLCEYTHKTVELTAGAVK